MNVLKKQIILHYKFPQTVSTVMLVSSAKKIQVKSILSENENVCVHYKSNVQKTCFAAQHVFLSAGLVVLLERIRLDIISEISSHNVAIL